MGRGRISDSAACSTARNWRKLTGEGTRTIQAIIHDWNLWFGHILRPEPVCRASVGAVFRGRAASIQEGARSRRRSGGMRLRFGPRPTGPQIVCVFPSRSCAAWIAQEKGAERPLRPEPGLQADPAKGGEDHIEMEVQFGLCAGLAIIEAQVMLGVVEEHPLHRLRVGAAWQGVDHLGFNARPDCRSIVSSRPNTRRPPGSRWYISRASSRQGGPTRLVQYWWYRAKSGSAGPPQHPQAG